MKVTVKNYTFDKTAKTVTLTDYASVNLGALFLIVNVTRGIVIFQLNSTTLTATAATNVFTLAYDTSAMNNADKLAIFYEDPTRDVDHKEDDAHVSGDSGVPAWSVRKDTAASTAGSDGDYAGIITDATGRLWSHVSALEPGVAATSLGKAEDAAHTDGDTGVMMLGVRKDVPTALAGSDGDYAVPEVDSIGRMWVVTGKLVVASTASSGLTTSTTAYTAGDMLGTIWTFSSIAAANGGAFEIVSATIFDKAAIIGPTDLFLFDTSVTQAADNAANSWSDADMGHCVGVISMPPPNVSALNAVGTVPNLSLLGVTDAADTALYGGLVTRIGHTFFGAAGDLTVRLVVRRA